jgi:hypothetical protein
MLHSMTLFLCSAYQSFPPSAYATHVVGTNAEFCCVVISDYTKKKKKDVTSSTNKGVTDSQTLALCS